MPKKICIVTPDIMGPVTCGGVGSAFYALALTLSKQGNSVEILFVDFENTSDEKMQIWIREYHNLGIKLGRLKHSNERIEAGETLKNAYLVYDHLKTENFDFIHFADMKGLAYLVLLAKSQGLALLNSEIVIHLHGTLAWHKKGNEEFFQSDEELMTDFLEQQSLKLATNIVSPSQYMLDYHKLKGEVIQHCPLPPLPEAPATNKKDKIIFFGRLESRKGLALFCDVLDSLTPAQLSSREIIFLGKSGYIDGLSGSDYVRKRAQQWRFPYQVICNFDQQQAIRYLQQHAHLAVIPSLSDNSPMSITECITYNIPFVSLNTGGIPELLVDDQNLSDPDFFHFKEKLLRQLSTPSLGVFKKSPQFSVSRWSEFHSTTYPQRQGLKKNFLVSICLISNKRPEFLKAAEQSLQEQTYKNVELILLEAEGRTPGAARNAAAQKAKGDYLLFMDDDNLALPQEIESFVIAASNTNADVYTCPFRRFQGKNIISRWVPAGPHIALGLKQNVFGDTNFFIKKEVFLNLQGFNENSIFGEDWEFLSRLVLNGFKLEIIPEILFHYREHDQNFSNSSKLKRISRDRLSPYLKKFDPHFHKLIEAVAQPTPQPNTFMLVSDAANLDLDPAAIIQHVEKTHDAEISLDQNGVTVQSTGSDPWLILRVPEDMIGPLSVELWLTTTESSEIKLYWKNSDHFTEDLALYKMTRDQVGKIDFIISDELRSGQLRFDFGNKINTFLLHRLKLTSLKTPVVRAPEAYDRLRKEVQQIKEQIKGLVLFDGSKLSDLTTSNCTLSFQKNSELTALNEDPQILFPEFAVPAKNIALIFINEGRYHRVYWKFSADDIFEEKNSMLFDQEALITAEKPISQLRLDPNPNNGKLSFDLIFVSSKLI